MAKIAKKIVSYVRGESKGGQGALLFATLPSFRKTTYVPTKVWICKKILWYKCTDDQLNTFLTDLLCDQSKSEEKVFNWPQGHP